MFKVSYFPTVLLQGVLADGREIAVKRLFFNTRHRVADFYNEVNMISSIEHKNLVRLLGCSCTGPESLLVYEYLPNKSLDGFIFGRPLVFSLPPFACFRSMLDNQCQLVITLCLIFSSCSNFQLLPGLVTARSFLQMTCSLHLLITYLPLSISRCQIQLVLDN